MELSIETRNFIIEINEFSHNKLKNINDVSLLVETSRKDKEGKKLFSELIFSAKYLNGLGKILMNSITGDKDTVSNEKEKTLIKNSAGKVKDEYKKNIELLINQINELLSKADKDDKMSFADRYLNMTRTSMINLTSLIYDLSWVKKYYNEKGI